eukprot:1512870-Alexandrium_andersonii.AAC.1
MRPLPHCRCGPFCRPCGFGGRPRPGPAGGGRCEAPAHCGDAPPCGRRCPFGAGLAGCAGDHCLGAYGRSRGTAAGAPPHVRGHSAGHRHAHVQGAHAQDHFRPQRGRGE